MPSAKKKNPTVTRLEFECSGGATQFVDVGRSLSILNRKFFRAGLYYYINSVEIYNNESGVIDLHTLQDSWVTRNAHQRGEALFDKMNRLVGSPMSLVGTPKYHDFKVYMSDLHRTVGSVNPVAHGINATYSVGGMTPNDWVYSKFVSADSDGDFNVAGTALEQEADNFFVHMIGPHSGSSADWNSVGLIKSYGESRPLPHYTDPSLPQNAAGDTLAAVDPMMSIFDFSSEEQLNDIITNLDSDNDSPPYDLDYYIGESVNGMQQVARIGTEIGVGRVGRASGFCAPFGLICIDPHGVSTAFRVVINLAVGKYKGVFAERA